MGVNLKKIFCLFLIVFIITGCGKAEINKNSNKEEQIKKYSLISTTDRLVFKNGSNYEIIYYENSKIVKVESAIKFNTEAEAKKYFNEESYGTSDIISYIYDTFIIEQTEDYWEDFKDLSPEELKEYFKNANFEYVS